MKIQIEFRTDLSRRELRQLLQIGIESTARLAHRMDIPDLNRVEAAASTLAGLAAAEKMRRAGPTIDASPIMLTRSAELQ